MDTYNELQDLLEVERHQRSLERTHHDLLVRVALACEDPAEGMDLLRWASNLEGQAL